MMEFNFFDFNTLAKKAYIYVKHLNIIQAKNINIIYIKNNNK